MPANTIYELPEMPDIFREMVILLSNKHRKATPSMILNMVICKTAFALTSKRVQYKEIEKLGFPNWYTVIFAYSGCGKDRIDEDLDNYFFKNFRLWFDTKAQEWYEQQVRCIENIADDMFNSDKASDLSKKKAYITQEKSKIRELVFEVYNGTPEGIFEEAKIRSKYKLGAIFVKMTEFAKYFLNSKTEDKQFFSLLLIAYGGKYPSKCTKNDKREKDIIGVPLNCLLMCDISLFEPPKARQELMLELQTGFARRSMITFIPRIKLLNNIDVKQALEDDKNFYKNADIINEEFIKIFSRIDDYSIYDMPEEVILHIKEYEKELNILANETDNELLRKEILDRQLKSIKLATIFAAFSHSEKIITMTDIKQAIGVIEYLSKDFKAFVNHKPRHIDKYDELFNFFLENENKHFTKMQIIKKAQLFGFSQRKLSDDFENAIDFIINYADDAGYNFLSRPCNHNSGMEYWLSKKIDDNEIGHKTLTNIIIENPKNPQNAA